KPSRCLPALAQTIGEGTFPPRVRNVLNVASALACPRKRRYDSPTKRRRCLMNRNYFPRLLIIFACLVLSAFAQMEKIVIPAGTPEDQGLQDISKEEAAPKKASMYHEFVQKFSSNP